MNGPVDGGALSDPELDRYARHIVLRDIGGQGQQRLKAARVLVVGAGGIGCPALASLAAAGVGRIRIVDDDRVQLSNLQRQTLFGEDDIGALKAERAAAALRRLNPHVALEPVTRRFTADSAAGLIEGMDVVLDGTDSFASRLVVADAALAARLPLVSAAVAMFQGQVATFRGWLADAPCYRCFVGDAFETDDCDSCAELGVLGAMCGVVGSFAALEVIRAITGFGEEATGKLHIIDGLKPGWRTLSLPKDRGCRSCAALASAPAG